jgi:hypothetical protein
MLEEVYITPSAAGLVHPTIPPLSSIMELGEQIFAISIEFRRS